MDKLVAEIETEISTETVQEADALPVKKSYAESFENKTLGDFVKERQKKEDQKFNTEKEHLIQQQFERVEVPAQEVSKNIIEKPNYDLIEENTKIVKIKRKEKQQKKVKKKTVGIFLACALAISGIICVANSVVIDSLKSSYSQINETYNVNLRKYLKNIENLDATKKSLGMIETYPEELLDAGDVGKKTNWFDKICEFFSGFFGG